MKRYFFLFIIISVFSSLFINCGEDEVICPDHGSSDPTVNIINPADGESFTVGETVTFIGGGEDHEGVDIPEDKLVWMSDRDDTVGIGILFGNNALSVNTHVITLTGTDSDGRIDSESITIEINQLPGFVLIPADTFTMGSPAGESGRETDETLHLVTLTNNFYFSQKEVTNQQYADMAQWAYDNGYCTATGASLQDNLDGSAVELLNMDDSDCEISFSAGTFTVDSGKEDHPVREVSWHGAASYCDWLSMKAGLGRAYDHVTWECNGHEPYDAEGYRLPTEAEWENACRGGTQTAFANGDIVNIACSDPVLDEIGWYCGNADSRTQSVGQLIPNDWGLYDMHGNLWEWVNDWNHNYSGDVTDPVGPVSGFYRILRGGSWYNDARYCRSASREWGTPGNTSDIRGFRVCRSVPGN